MGEKGIFKGYIVPHGYKVVFFSVIKIVRKFACFYGEA